MESIMNLHLETDLPVYLNKEETEYLKSLNITNLGELFNAYNSGLFNDRRKRINKFIMGQTEFLMAYYLKTPVIATSLLTETIRLDEATSFLGSDSDKKLQKNLQRIGMSSGEYVLLFNYISIKGNNFCDMHGEKIDNVMIIQIIERFVNDKEYQMKLISETHEKSPMQQVIRNLVFKYEFYAKNLKFGKGHFDESQTTLINLKSQMDFLVKTKNRLDTQIELLQNQINNISKNGGKQR